MATEEHKLFQSNLRTLYKKIDVLSSTMWGQSSLMETKLRSADSRENDNWKKETKAQIGYGEITKGHMTQILTLMQHITDLLPAEKHKDLIEPIDSYNISEESHFLDIGSGFGKPVFHAAMQIGCESKGIEVVPARVEFSVDFLMEISENKGKWNNSKGKQGITTDISATAKKSVDEDSAVESDPVSPRKRKSAENGELNEILRKYKVISTQKKKRGTAIKDWSVVEWADMLSKRELVESKKAKGIIVPQHHAPEETTTNEKIDEKLKRKQKLMPKYEIATNFEENWYEKVKFERIDATTLKFYGNDQGEHFTHIYSYNKVMSKETIRSICEILNNTDYKVLAWYFNDNETRKCGLKNCILVHKMPMLSTGSEKFTIYIYVKTKPCDVKESSSKKEDDEEQEEENSYKGR